MYNEFVRIGLAFIMGWGMRGFLEVNNLLTERFNAVLMPLALLILIAIFIYGVYKKDDENKG